MKPEIGAEIALKGFKQFEEGAKTLGTAIKGGKLAKEAEPLGAESFKGGEAGKKTYQTMVKAGKLEGAASILETPAETKLSPDQYWTKLLKKTTDDPTDTGAQAAFAYAGPLIEKFKTLSAARSYYDGTPAVQQFEVPLSTAYRGLEALPLATLSNLKPGSEEYKQKYTEIYNKVLDNANKSYSGTPDYYRNEIATHFTEAVFQPETYFPKVGVLFKSYETLGDSISALADKGVSVAPMLMWKGRVKTGKDLGVNQPAKATPPGALKPSPKKRSKEAKTNAVAPAIISEADLRNQ